MTCFSVCFFVFLYFFIYLFLYVFLYLSLALYLFLSLSLCFSICLSLCLSLSLSHSRHDKHVCYAVAVLAQLLSEAKAFKAFKQRLCLKTEGAFIFFKKKTNQIFICGCTKLKN